MKMDKINKKKYIFSHSASDIFWGKYLYVFALFGWGIVLLIEIFSLKSAMLNIKIIGQMGSVVIFLPVVLTGLGLFYLAQYKQAYRLEFDFDQQVMSLALYRFGGRKIYNINELIKVKLDGFIILKFKDGKSFWIRYDSELIQLLKANGIQREWGKAGKFFMKKDYLSDQN